jgi:hypothetical protein
MKDLARALLTAVRTIARRLATSASGSDLTA